jgi:superfamily I DNA/RNA helicase
MQLTDEQIAIIGSSGNIKINAVAGSGKTTTIIEYARTRPEDSKILYLAFNKSVKLEAQKKFNDKGLNNVSVETAHSIAYKYTVSKFGYRIRTQEYKSTDVVECLELSVNGGEKHDVYVIANHILKLAAYFCNSDKEKVSELDYLSLIQEADAKAFVQKNYEFIELQTRTFLGMMNKGEIEITHDFYLKRFQLLKPQLPFDYILFDEGQDASAAMLDVFFRQRATKVIVGDTHQQIYSWRFAVNSLEKADFTTYQLSKSFRFPQEIAVLAQAVLQRKELLGEYKAVDISGLGRSTEIKVKAILARTNLGLLIRAIEFVTGKKDLGSIYFEGNINSYMYADEGASLYDILNLYNGEKKNIRDKLIRNMRDVVELEDYIDKTEDAQLGMMLEIIKEYGNRIPGILKSIKEKHVENSEREKAEIIFSTVHRCKGLEYDVVQLVDDFTTEEKIEKMMASGERNEIFLSKLNEEINLLYVAVTRAKNQLIIPIDLLPHEIEPSYRIRVIRPELEETDNQKSGKNNQKAKSQNKSFTKTNQSNSNAYNPWTEYMDEELTTLYLRGECIEDLSAYFSRTPSSIKSRLKKLGLE